MNRYLIQARRADGWRHVTTIHFDPLATRVKDGVLPKAAALRSARRQLGAWRLYHGFADAPLRIVESTLKGEVPV